MRVPLLKRLAVHLEKHGLTFGDALNLAMLVLTLFTLYYAKITLKEAHDQAVDAKSQAEQATKDQQDQFKKQETQLELQTEELRSVNNAMTAAKKALTIQTDTLRSLQGTSKRQLATQTKFWEKINAQPQPVMAIMCNGENINLADGGDDIRKTETHKISPNTQDEPNFCGIELWNRGKADLTGIELTVWINCLSEGDEPFIADKEHRSEEAHTFILNSISPGTRRDAWINNFELRINNKTCESFYLDSKLRSNFGKIIETVSGFEVTGKR